MKLRLGLSVSLLGILLSGCKLGKQATAFEKMCKAHQDEVISLDANTSFDILYGYGPKDKKTDYDYVDTSFYIKNKEATISQTGQTVTYSIQIVIHSDAITYEGEEDLPKGRKDIRNFAEMSVDDKDTGTSISGDKHTRYFFIKESDCSLELYNRISERSDNWHHQEKEIFEKELPKVLKLYKSWLEENEYPLSVVRGLENLK